MDDREIVLALQDAMISKVGRDRYELWFAAKARLTAQAELVQVVAANQFTLDNIRRIFRAELAEAAAEVCGLDTRVEYRFDESMVPVQSDAAKAASGLADAEPAILKLNAETASAPAGKTSRRNTKASPASDSTTNAKNRGNAKKSGNSTAGGSRPRRLPRRPSKRLEQFVVGKGNQLAFTAVQSALTRMGSASPLLLYGPPGSGKSHLLEGFAFAARSLSGLRRVVSMSAEQFTTAFLDALKGGGLPNFRNKYRELDVLLIDDIQFFAGKRATLVELQQTIDTLTRDGKQIVLTADRSPAELQSLGAELVARISGGLVCDVEQADHSTRLGILKHMAREHDFDLCDCVADVVATRISGDARQLNGAVHRLRAVHEAMGQAVTTESVESALHDIFHSARSVIRMTDIEAAVCEVFGVDSESLMSGRRVKSISQPRMLAMWLARKYTRAALSEIGEHFGRRSHSTVISAQKKVEQWMSGGVTIQIGHANCQVTDALRRLEVRLQTG